jgi:hypothetical protein
VQCGFAADRQAILKKNGATLGSAILSDSVSPTISVAPSLWRDNATSVFTFDQFSPSGISYTIRILGGTMEKTKRDWHQIAAQLRTETDSDKRKMTAATARARRLARNADNGPISWRPTSRGTRNPSRGFLEDWPYAPAKKGSAHVTVKTSAQMDQRVATVSNSDQNLLQLRLGSDHEKA